MKIFLDTNVLVSSFAFEGSTRTLVSYLVGYEVAVSPQVIEEFRRISIEKIKSDPLKVEAFLDAFSKIANVVLPPYLDRLPVRDPDDVDILAAALKSEAVYLVTGDKDLLSVDTGGAIAIVTPRELFDIFSQEGK